MSRPGWVLGTGILLLASGCTVGPDYRAPALEARARSAWGEAAGDRVVSGGPELVRWWNVFQDPTLSSLVDRALRSNLDLALAEARVREARAQYKVVFGDLLPQLNVSGSYARERVSTNGPQFFPGIPIPTSRNLYTAGFDSEWEIDVFGGTRRGMEAASADIDASVEDRRSVLVTLLGEVARNYLGVRGSQRQLSVERENLRSARDTLALTRSRLAAGLTTDLDVARAEGLLATTASLLPPLEVALKQAIHRLGILLGQEPNALAAELLPERPIPAPPPQVVVGLPSELLRRRPDVRRAERQLAAATARVGVATADLYPKFSITGEFGLQSLSSADFWKWPSRMWSIGPSVSWPIFQGGKILANIEVNDARVDEARISFESAFLTALGDVEDALVSYLEEWDRRRSLADAVRSNERAVSLANDLYTKGLSGFLDVLNSEQALYALQQQLAQSDAQVSLNLVALYKALGGGWQAEREPR